MSRDAYRRKVYDSEFELRFYAKKGVTETDFYGTTLSLPEPRKFGDLAGVQRFVDAVCGMDVVRDAYPMVKNPPTVRARSNDSHAHYQSLGNEIAVPDHKGVWNSWAMTEMVVLHELAHYFTSEKHDPTGDHGTDFCVCFMFLLKNVLGGGWNLLLMRALDEKGVPLCKDTSQSVSASG